MRGLRSSFGVEAALRREGKGLGQAAETLRRAGFRAEAAALEVPGLVARAEGLRQAGRFLVRGDALYPMGWERYLGEGAPAAIWCSGGAAVRRAMRVGVETGARIRLASIVGLRRTEDFPGSFEATRRAGRAVAEAGRAVLSGGARGCDQAGVAGALAGPVGGPEPSRGASGSSSPGGSGRLLGEIRAVEVLAMGLAYHARDIGRLDRRGDRGPNRDGLNRDGLNRDGGGGIGGDDDSVVMRLSMCPPEMGFSTAAAMERNALIYAGGEATLVAASNFRQGGTWVGATSALRQRMGRVYVLDPACLEGDSGVPLVAEDGPHKEPGGELSRAAYALWALGAGRVSHPEVFGHLWGRNSSKSSSFVGALVGCSNGVEVDLNLSLMRGCSRARENAEALLRQEAMGAPAQPIREGRCDPPGFASPLRTLSLFESPFDGDSPFESPVDGEIKSAAS